MLPEGWKSEKLGDLCTLNPKCPHIQSASLTSFISMDGVSNDAKISRVTLHHFKKEKNGFSYFQEHDILVAKITPCFENGKGGYLDKLPTSHGFGSTEFHVLRPSPNADGKFIYYITTSERFRTLGEMNMQGSAGQKRVPKNFIERFSIATPPLPEQKKIAAILSTWDRAIEGTEKLLANSQQQKKALMQQLLTGKKRLPGFTGEWKLSPISAFIKESRISGNSGDVAKKITIKLYGRGVLPKEEKREGSESTKYYKRKSGQFIYSKLDFLNGAFGIIPPSLDGYESTLDLPAFDFLHNVSSQWFIFYVSREEFYSANLGLANGGRKARRVNPSDLLRISVPTPPLPEQKAIAAVLTTADEEITALESDLSRLRQEKKALMQQLLTGKRRVTVD